MDAGDEEVDVASPMVEWFWPAFALGDVFDCAGLAHDCKVMNIYVYDLLVVSSDNVSGVVNGMYDI